MVAFNVSQLLKTSVGTTRDYDFDEREPELEASAGLRGPIRGHVHLTRTGHGILVQTDYSGNVELVCGRCVDPFVHETSGTIEEEFLPLIDIKTGEPLAVEGEEFRLTEAHVLDLNEALRQDLLTRVPLRPLCAEDCPGLCPQCGASRREGTCSCEPVSEESPFRALAALLEPQDGKDTPGKNGE
jgi:uncharacterized protein